MNRYELYLPITKPEFYPGRKFIYRGDSSRIYTLDRPHEDRENIWYLGTPEMGDRPLIIDSEEHLRTYYEQI